MPHELHATDIDLYREIYITPYIKRCTQVYLSQFCVENRSNVHAAGVRAIMSFAKNIRSVPTKNNSALGRNRRFVKLKAKFVNLLDVQINSAFTFVHQNFFCMNIWQSISMVGAMQFSFFRTIVQNSLFIANNEFAEIN